MSDMSEQPEQPGEPRASALEVYVREHRASYTEDALRQQALAAGHPAAAIEAALLATRQVSKPSHGRRATRNTFLAYLGVYLVLDVGMVLNPSNNTGGFFGNTTGLGILILSVTLGAGFVGSLVWIASRRLFAILAGICIVFIGLLMVASNLLLGAVTGGAGALLVVAALRYGHGSAGTAAGPSPSMQLLVSIPILFLLAVGGICLASGLPIPHLG